MVSFSLNKLDSDSPYSMIHYEELKVGRHVWSHISPLRLFFVVMGFALKR